MADLVVVVMELGLMVVVVVPRAQLEDVRQGGEEEQQELEHQLFGRAHAHQDGQQPQQLDLDELDDQHNRQE